VREVQRVLAELVAAGSSGFDAVLLDGEQIREVGVGPQADLDAGRRECRDRCRGDGTTPRRPRPYQAVGARDRRTWR
jgi:hypothetical protein